MEKNESRWKKFGRLLKEARMQIIDEETGEPITIGNIADLAHISRVQWSRYENGVSGVKSTTIPLIAKALGRKTEEEISEVFRWAGFYREEKPFQLPPSIKRYIELPIEIQRDFAKQIERAWEFEQLKKKERGKK